VDLNLSFYHALPSSYVIHDNPFTTKLETSQLLVITTIMIYYEMIFRSYYSVFIIGLCVCTYVLDILYYHSYPFMMV
jgi:hypothetical protein